jgi:uncharacterized membrane protein YhaH (DUF805 family)
MAYCAQCGNPITTPFCPRCGTAAAAADVASPAQVALAPTARVDEPVRPDGFYRSPAIVYWFTVITFGIYSYYYLIRERRLARRRLGYTDETYWTAFKLIIPIYGLFYYFESWSEIGRRVEASAIKLPVPIATQAIPLFLGGVLWRLPDDVWIWVYLVGCIAMGTIHMSVAHAERIDEPAYRWPRLAIVEWVLLVVCSLLFVLATIGLGMDDAGNVNWSVTGTALAAFVVVLGIFQFDYGKISRPQ